METRLRLRNSKMSPVPLTIEPWGVIFKLLPDVRVEIVCEGPSDASLDIDTHPEGMTLYAGPGCVVRILQDGKEVPETAGMSPVPGLPPGMSVEHFVRWMNKHTEQR